MKKTTLFGCLIFVIIMVTFSMASESTDCPNIIIMEHKEAFEQHRMGIVEFKHKTHVSEYGYNCGACHHDDEGTPLNYITYEDEIDNCIDCHSKPGGNINSPIEYFSGAIHQNCINCHKEDGGPVRCNECH